jgi:cathepsin B
MVPTQFDSRTKFGSCVHPIRNQEHCGSCWAFAGSEALSDRFCIASNKSVNPVLSPEDLVECDHTDMGCNGGWIGNAWKYMENTGIATDSCMPYTSGAGKSGSCPTKCADGKAMKMFKCKSGSVVEATSAS